MIPRARASQENNSKLAKFYARSNERQPRPGKSLLCFLSNCRQDCFFNCLPGLASWIEDIEMPGAWNLKQMHVFFLCRNVSVWQRRNPTEIRRHGIIRGAVNQPLSSLRDRKLRGIGFAVMVGNLAGCSVKKLDHCIIAEMKLVGASQVNDPGE